MNHFDYRNGVLHAEAVNLIELAEAVGTPFYCYSTATLERHYRVFTEAFAGEKALVCYAMKANSNQSVLRTLRTPRWLGTEVLAAVVVALALIPEAIAFSIIAGVDPRVGLFASFTMAVTTAIVGGRPAMISAATGAVALVVAPLSHAYGVGHLLAAIILGGVIQILLGVFGVARLMRFVPRSVMVGFVNALAILVFTSQLPELIGVPWLVYPLTALALGIVLLLTTIFQVRYGLAPLKRISDAIADIRSGRAERLEGRFPVEIAPLARETNALIDANREIVERSRTHVGNLAHAIKTPLSVIVNEAASHGADPFASKVLEQADVMRDQVAHHLERARIAARATIVSTITDVAPVIEALRRTMEKIHRDRDLSIEAKADPAARFRGERQDLEEMVGNLVDNACKWAASQVFIEVSVVPPEAPGAGPKLRIAVDDDGRGLSEDERAKVARRGQRLDESKPGSGLGLSIVRRLGERFGWPVSLESQPGQGTTATIRLPADRVIRNVA